MFPCNHQALLRTKEYFNRVMEKTISLFNLKSSCPDIYEVSEVPGNRHLGDSKALFKHLSQDSQFLLYSNSCFPPYPQMKVQLKLVKGRQKAGQAQTQRNKNSHVAERCFYMVSTGSVPHTLSKKKKALSLGKSGLVLAPLFYLDLPYYDSIQNFCLI